MWGRLAGVVFVFVASAGCGAGEAQEPGAPEAEAVESELPPTAEPRPVESRPHLAAEPLPIAESIPTPGRLLDDDPGAGSAASRLEAPKAPRCEADAGARPCFVRPDSIRGIYLNAWAAGSARRLDNLLALARRTEINTFVIDIKDATGFVSHASSLPEVRAAGADEEIRIRDLSGLLRRLEGEGIYPIARIVIVKDPLLAAARPELAVQDTAGGIWLDSKGIAWLNLYDERVWDYHTSLAVEVAKIGFPEIQWDYVRFPDAPESDLARARFPGDSLGPRTEAVRGFLTSAREELRTTGLDLRHTADVFGVTTSFRNDVGIGQLWERFIDRVDAALPMVYPSHYWAGSFGYRVPNAHPYAVVREAIASAIRRSAEVDSAGEVIPWLQDFTLGAPAYGSPEVRAQIEATYDAGAKDWILWNPGSRYTEAALRPVEGWHHEPHVRVGARIVPVSDRLAAFEVAVDSVRRARVVTDSLRADSIAELRAAGAAPDTLLRQR
ncbi:MAG: putative glycoside hydrolase [Longimicrobiales bacterium]|nr:putative glycoside hydrolase [Longimicrobiales bacterium]